MVSLNSSGDPADNLSAPISMSADGRFVGISTSATNLGGERTNGLFQAYVRDRVDGTMELVGVGTNGEIGPRANLGANLSADGRYVAFWSSSGNLVPGDINGRPDLNEVDLPGLRTSSFAIARNKRPNA